MLQFFIHSAIRYSGGTIFFVTTMYNNIDTFIDIIPPFVVNLSVIIVSHALFGRA